MHLIHLINLKSQKKKSIRTIDKKIERIWLLASELLLNSDERKSKYRRLTCFAKTTA